MRLWIVTFQIDGKLSMSTSNKFCWISFVEKPFNHKFILLKIYCRLFPCDSILNHNFFPYLILLSFITFQSIFWVDACFFQNFIFSFNSKLKFQFVHISTQFVVVFMDVCDKKTKHVQRTRFSISHLLKLPFLTHGIISNTTRVHYFLCVCVYICDRNATSVWLATIGILLNTLMNSAFNAT